MLIFILPVSVISCNKQVKTPVSFSFGIGNMSCEVNGVVYYVDINNNFKLRAYNINTKNETFLCKDPICDHSSGCASYYSAFTYYVATDGYALYFISQYSTYNEVTYEDKDQNVIYRYDLNDCSCIRLVALDATGSSSVSCIIPDNDVHGYIYYTYGHTDGEKDYNRIYRVPKKSGSPELCLDDLPKSLNFDVYDDYIIYSGDKNLFTYNITNGESHRFDGGFSNFRVYGDCLYGYTTGEITDNFSLYYFAKAELNDMEDITVQNIYTDYRIESIYFGSSDIYLLTNEHIYVYTREPYPGEGDAPVDVYRENLGYYIKYDPNNNSFTRIEMGDNNLTSGWLLYAGDTDYIGAIRKLLSVTTFDDNISGYYHINITSGDLKKLG